MTRLDRAAIPAALSLALAAGSAVAAPTANGFDGSWSVVATTENGSCAGPFRYPIVIRDGNVDEAGDTGVDASGRTGADGRITGTIRSGLASVSVSGRLSGAGGTGRWRLSGLTACSGRWTARRTG
ncbi:hypothetical protein [Methylobacterium sp. NEAU K]|uniref:hypothetical protein n=1 Tax=Methylobacterium sp. NEAU K TaxID=3064946 RepID=UPI002736E2F2|nr:hypothetical protein [Methylobacterium sp. NEAU K]MDP4006229.1 hypothetical protein [Methylobacterium sp. NEAU K]